MNTTPLRLLTLAAACLAASITISPPLSAGEVSFPENFRPALPVIPDRTFTLTDFGAVGDGGRSIPRPFRRRSMPSKKPGGGHLVVPKGVFRTLPFFLCSKLDLHLDEGAVIQAPVTFEEMGLPDPATLKSQDEVRARVKTPAP